MQRKGDTCQFRQTEIHGQPRKNRRKVVDLYNLVVYLKIIFRESLFFGKLENWDRITPSNSARAHGTTLKFMNERANRVELLRSGNLLSATHVLQNLRKEHIRKPCNKKRCARGEA